MAELPNDLVVPEDSEPTANAAPSDLVVPEDYKAAPPATASGVASQLGRGAEAGLYHAAGAPVDMASDVWQSAKGLVGGPLVQDVESLYNTGRLGPKPSVEGSPALPGGSEWMMGKAGQVSPQLDPRNYPAQNWPERIARGAGDVGTQAALGRVAGFGGSLAAGEALPSSVSVAKQLAGSAIAGAGGGAGGETGRGMASYAIPPDFRTQHPAATNLIEGLSGVIGGAVGGGAGSSAVNRAGMAGGAPGADLSSGQLKTIAQGQYTTAKNIPANFQIPAVAQWASNHLQNLYNNYGSSEIGPIASRLNKLANPPANAAYVPLTELTALDDAFGKVVQKNIQPGGMNKLGAAAADTQNAIKSFVRNPTPQSVHSGDPYTAAQYFKTADGNYAAAKRSETIEQAQQQGDRSGDLEGAIGKLTNPAVVAKRLRGFTPDEQQQLDSFAQGSTTRNALGAGASFFNPGHGGGLSAPVMMYEGYKTAGVPGMIAAGLLPATAGYALRQGREALANRALDQISAQTRQRSPAYQAIPVDQRAASPFRSSIPVGLGALNGLYGQ